MTVFETNFVQEIPYLFFVHFYEKYFLFIVYLYIMFKIKKNLPLLRFVLRMQWFIIVLKFNIITNPAIDSAIHPNKWYILGVWPVVKVPSLISIPIYLYSNKA